jgi:hypothetical protein
MKPDRIAIPASTVFMLVAWLLFSGFLAFALTGRLLARTTVAYVLLGLVIVAWFLIPLQVLRYYRHRARKLR